MSTTMGNDLYMKAIVDHEDGMSQLYLALGRFSADSKQRALWDRLAEEEAAQARLMETLRTNGEDFGVELTHKRPTTKDLMDSTCAIQQAIERITAKGIKGKEGLDIARRFEMQDVEQKVYEAFTTTSEELLGLLMTTRMLNDLHPEHLDEMDQMINQRVFSSSRLFGMGKDTPTSTSAESGIDILDNSGGLGTVRMRILPRKGDIDHIKKTKPSEPQPSDGETEGGG